ncbi:hypothetical protein PR048_030489 [Dryococelus australis]|uniref:Uncharacterized protein n=1 Tax=Dryococelus australis TaxID=614101 RepID=A0ABQ9GBZ3_9NEOP|nr:hypothetical protein PR048_030489 [Dryococelus australis]
MEVEQLARLPPIEVQSPAGSPDFREWESCRTVPLVGGFSWGSPGFQKWSFYRERPIATDTALDKRGFKSREQSLFYRLGNTEIEFIFLTSKHTSQRQTFSRGGLRWPENNCESRIQTSRTRVSPPFLGISLPPPPLPSRLYHANHVSIAGGRLPYELPAARDSKFGGSRLPAVLHPTPPPPSNPFSSRPHLPSKQKEGGEGIKKDPEQPAPLEPPASTFIPDVPTLPATLADLRMQQRNISSQQKKSSQYYIFRHYQWRNCEPKNRVETFTSGPLPPSIPRIEIMSTKLMKEGTGAIRSLVGVSRNRVLLWLTTLDCKSRVCWAKEALQSFSMPDASTGTWHDVPMILQRVQQRNDGNTARLARRSDEALEVRVSVARIAPSLLDLGRGGSFRKCWIKCEQPAGGSGQNVSRFAYAIRVFGRRAGQDAWDVVGCAAVALAKRGKVAASKSIPRAPLLTQLADSRT